MTIEKYELLKYMDNPVTTTARNSMGCSENWYDPYYAIMHTFTKKEIENMSETEITHLVMLGTVIADNLY